MKYFFTPALQLIAALNMAYWGRDDKTSWRLSISTAAVAALSLVLAVGRYRRDKRNELSEA